MRHYLYLIGILIPFLLNAQETDKNGFYNEPVEFSEYVKQDFINSFYFDGEPLSKLNFNSERTWIVYSDRANNPVYDRFNGSRQVDKINFMDPLYVKQIQGSWLHVYSKRKKDLGWIHVEYLVICRYAILNTGSAAPRKGMALISLNEDVDPNDLQDSKKLQYNYYSDPDLNSDAYRGKSDKFKIHFILKETASAKLLSETDKLNENDKQTKSAVRGWMANLNITNWDTRICLEPSTSRLAVADYSSKIIPVFPQESHLKEMYDRPDPAQNAIMKNIVSDELLSPYTMRMPILEHLSSKNKKVATVGKLDYQIPDNEVNDFNCLEEIEELDKKLKNINIVFVIDGTQSMGEFYKPVVSSISAIIDNPIDVDANIRFGAIIYRDYPDNSDAYKVYSLTSDYDRIKSKLSNTVPFSNDNDLPEAQYNAIINGIPEVGFKKGQSNIVILIGDCGNHDPDLKNQSIDDAIEVLKPFDVNFISFQVIQGPDFSYVTFNLDSKTYIESILADRKTEVTGSIGELERISGTNTFQYVIDKDISITNLYGFGRLTFANMNQPMSTFELKRNVKDAIRSNIEAIEENLLNLRATCGDGSGVVNGKDAIGGSYEEELLRYLARKYSEKTGKSYEKSLELYRNANLGEMSFIGYTSTKFYNKKEDCYDKVVYLSQTEFDDLVNIFDRLLKSSGSNSTKRAFKSALSIQVKTVLGSDISQSYIDNLTLEEVWYAILTLPFDEFSIYGEIGTTRLKDLVNTTDPSFNMFYDDYINKIKGFGPAKYQERSFKMGGTRHYWVPLNDFPGNG